MKTQEELLEAWNKITVFAKELGVALNPIIQVTPLQANEKINEEGGEESSNEGSKEDDLPAQEASNGDEAESK